MYNSLPTMLFLQQNELRQSGIQEFRLHFTIEGAKDIREILSAYLEVTNHDGLQAKLSGQYTKGHYKRGVE